jgi:hypothetical protein
MSIVSGFGGLAADQSGAPSLSVESVEGVHRVFVTVESEDLGSVRTLLRQTGTEPRQLVTGGEAARGAFFAAWSEAGSRWSSFTQDGGATWSDARAIRTAIRLRDGAIEPGFAMPEAPETLSLPAQGELFIVQFKSVSLPEWRLALADRGVEIFNYLPHNAHIVRMSPALRATVESLDFVQRLEPYHPYYRLSRELRDWSAAAAPEEQRRVRVMTLEWGPEGKQRVLEFANGIGAQTAQYWPSGHLFELWLTPSQLGQIAQHDDILWMDPWTPPETDMDLVREDAGTNWYENDSGICGQGVRGEVMDNGIEQNHMDFDGLLIHGPAPDIQSHGTNTTGIVFGNGDRDGDGNAQGTGHMPCAEQAIFADYGGLVDRFAHTQELKGSPYFASFQTNSWGDARTLSYTSVSHEMDDIIWRLDIAITQSQSNSGNQQSRPQAWGKNIISVGGVRHYNTLSTADDAWASGASIGPAEDGRIKPDVNYWYDSIYTTTTGNSYTTGFGGTSAATPEVAGVLGLMVRMWADNVWGTNPAGSTVFDKQPHFSTMKALLINNAQQYPFSGTADDLTRMHQGWGRPNLQLAKERAATSFVVDEETPLQLNQAEFYDIVVVEGESELKVTMVYPDPPGTTSAALHRINDLNLRVTSPSGTVYHGNVGLDVGTESSPGGSPNDIDTVENVFVANPEPGTWSVVVEAVEINQDAYLDTPGADAAFALVVTGGVLDQGECGNGIREGAEQCDGDDFGSATCDGQGCTGGGTLACNLDCTFDYSGCSGCPVCGNGTCERPENCSSCAADCISGSLATCGNNICEIANGEDCENCPSDCNGTSTGKKSDRYCCGSGAGQNPVGCTDTRCTSGGNTCLSTTAPLYCCGDETCEGGETTSNCSVDCGGSGSFCGDGVCDPGETECNCSQDCGSPPATESICGDLIDNDCDNLVDCDDPDCDGSSLCGQCLPLFQSCTRNSDCCNNRCRDIGFVQVCY